MTATLSAVRAAAIRDSFSRQGLMATLGAVITGLDLGHCEITAPILPGSRQQHGYGHAGLSFSIADSATGYAALSMLPDGYEILSIEQKINLLAPAVGDTLVATGRVVRAGRRIVVVQADVVAVTGAETHHIALLQGTLMPVAPT